MKNVGGVRPPLHQLMQRLVISLPLCIRKSKDEILESNVLDPIPHIIEELIVPHPGPMKVLSTLKCVGIKLPLKQGVSS